MLDAHGIAYMRINGKTSLPQRPQAMKLFQEEDGIRVMLVSITCGGAGYAHLPPLHVLVLTITRLDLTAASRAYLLEPHWNPMIEEQALCRVHRVGQKRTVTTIRYLIRNSFEEVCNQADTPSSFNACLQIYSKSLRYKSERGILPK